MFKHDDVQIYSLIISAESEVVKLSCCILWFRNVLHVSGLKIIHLSNYYFIIMSL